MELSTSVELANRKLSAEMWVFWLFLLCWKNVKWVNRNYKFFTGKILTRGCEHVHSKTCILPWINVFALSKRMYLLWT